MSLRTALGWLRDYCVEIAVSATLLVIVLKFCAVLTYRRDAFTDWEVVQMGIWSFFALAAIICMYNTAVSRVAVQKREACERKGGL